MSIQNIDDMYYLDCDVCGKAPDENFFDWDSAIAYKKRHGLEKPQGKWQVVRRLS